MTSRQSSCTLRSLEPVAKFHSGRFFVLSALYFARAYKESAEEFALAREIIKARAGAGLSQQELAQKMETTQSAVARLESGKHLPSMSTLKKLAKATGTRLAIHLEQS